MTKPKINAHVIISQGEITMLEMTEGAEAEERTIFADEIGKLIRLRNIVDAAIQDYERSFQQSFRKNPDKYIIWADKGTGGTGAIEQNQYTGRKQFNVSSDNGK